MIQVKHIDQGSYNWAPTDGPPQTAPAGYDSDVARERAVDYTTKIYAVSIREMSGTKPHQQQKEVSPEERYTPHDCDSAHGRPLTSLTHNAMLPSHPWYRCLSAA